MPSNTEALRCPVCDHREVGAVGARCPRDGAWLYVDEGPPDPLVGQILDGRFVIVGVAGSGRSGRIYRALMTEGDAGADPRSAIGRGPEATGGEIALRVLRPALARGAGLAEKLARSVPRLAQVDHPGVVVPFADWISGNLHCQASEMVHGPSPAALHGADPRRWVLLCAELCAALAAAARRGVFHHHLTPQKIRVVELEDGTLLPRVVDFGLAAIPFSTWQALGVLSPIARRFMAPELTAVPGDARADVYSVGVLLWWLMTDGHPEDDSRRPEAPAGLAAIADRAAARDPADRYPDADALRAALLALLTHPEALWQAPADRAAAEDADPAIAPSPVVDCTACAWALHAPGPRFDEGVEAIAARLAAAGLLDSTRERVFRRLMARADLLLCDAAAEPPHVARICPDCGATHSVRLAAIGALRHCATCGHRLPDSKLDAVIHQRPARPGHAVFDPTSGALRLDPIAVSARLELAGRSAPLPRRPATFHLADPGAGPLRITVSPRRRPALPAGYLRCAPADAAPGLAPDPRPLVDPGHLADVPVEGWPPALAPGDAIDYAITLTAGDQRAELRRFTVRPLPRVRASLVFEGEAPRDLGDALVTVARGAPFTLTLVADAALPPLDTITITLHGPDGRYTVPLEIRTHDRRATGVLPRIPAGPALAFTGLVPRDLPVGRDVRAELIARFHDTLGAMRIAGRWRVGATSSSVAPIPPALQLIIDDLPPIALAPERAVPVPLAGAVDRRVTLEIHARELPAVELKLKADGPTIDEMLTCVARDGASSTWRARVTLGEDSPGRLTLSADIGRSRVTWPCHIVAPPRVEATLTWDARPDMPFRHLLGPDRPLAIARPWPGARQARVHLRALGYPVDLEAIDAPEGQDPVDLGPLRLDPRQWQALTLGIGGELRLRVAGVQGGRPAIDLIRLARPVTATQPLQLVEGDVIAIDQVTAGQVDTRRLHLSNALPEPLHLAAVTTEGLPWIQIVRPDADGGGPIDSRDPLRLAPNAHTPLTLHIAPPADLPAAEDPVEGALLLWIPGLAAPVRLPVGVRRIIAIAPLPGPLALDLGALRIVARVATPDGPQTWRGRLGHGPDGRPDPERGVRAIALRLSRGLGMRPAAIQLVCPTGASPAERQALAMLLTESFGGVEVDITLDQATASALGALEAQLKDEPALTDIELMTVDIGARTTDVARIHARLQDARWQIDVRRRAVSHRAGGHFTRLLADELLRPAVSEALTALAGESDKKAAWYNRASTGKRRTGPAQGWYARARTGGRQVDLAAAADHPGDASVARSEAAVERIAEALKRAFGDRAEVQLAELETFDDTLDELLVDAPEGKKALTPEARARLAALVLRRDDYEPIVRAALAELFGAIAPLTDGAERVVLCGFSVHLPACLEAAQSTFSSVHLRIVPESLAARGAWWAAAERASVRWAGEPIVLDG